MNIQFIGEHLLYGKIGQGFVFLAFTSALLACFGYFFSSRKNNANGTRWKIIARSAFGVHALAVLGIMGTLFLLIYKHYFEYYYVWYHSSLSLPVHYMLACFWEGQEGSFLLWLFWHVVLSFFIIRKTDEWESPVMGIIALVQIFLTSMLLGVTIFGYKFGSNPFILLREHPEMANLPFATMPGYLSKILDGRGLNPLLQNYWMVIHPPTLFLGFAATVVPFAFAMAGLMRKKYTEWVKPALPYTVFGSMILGTGILMGGAWAYEALSFGGFWAWDPVENSSLMPWLTLIAALHVMLIFKHNGQSLTASFVLVIVTFLLVLYSTFLTRSGILGDTSVHAFTDLGLSGHLLVYILFFVVLSLTLLIINWKKIPSVKQQEENIYSREFWMFIGVLVLVISCFQITITTSIPVINKILGTHFAPPLDVKAHYNSWQIPIATVIALLLAVAQFLKWKKSDVKEVMKKLLLSFSVTLLLTVLAIVGLKMYSIHYIALLFTSTFAVIANFDYLLKIWKGKTKISPSSVAHIGFGLILLGALISNSRSSVISQNVSNANLGKDFSNNENIMLMQQDTLPMGNYFVTYKGKKRQGVNVYYEIEYFTRNQNTLRLEKIFSLKPVVQLNDKMGNVAEPDTKHFLTEDIYTHIVYADLEDAKHPESQYKITTKSITVGDTIMTNNCFVILTAINKNVDTTSMNLSKTDIAVGATLQIIDMQKKEYTAEPIYVLKDNIVYGKEAVIDTLGLKFIFNKITPETGKIDIVTAEDRANIRDFVIMKAIVFPYINLLWLGAVLFIIGSVLAIRKRIKKSNG